jgi:hypothetical protein
MDFRFGGEILADSDFLVSLHNQFDSLHPLFMMAFRGMGSAGFSDFPISALVVYRQYADNKYETMDRL